MGNFDRGGNKGGGYNKGGFGGGKPTFQKKSWGNDSDRETMMHKATCAECSKTCEVPFRPTSGKPVFCNECFNGQRDSNDSRGGRPSFNDRGPKRDFGGDRPSFRSEPRSEFKPAPAYDDSKQKLAEISMKLDRLITVMEKMTVAPVAPAPKEKKVEAPKAEALKVETKKPEVKKAAAKAPAKVVATPAVKKAAKAPAKKVVAKKKK